MRKDFGAKPWAYPQPVFIIATYNDDGTPNAMIAAWGGISEENEITICIDNGHKTAENLLKRRAFSVSMGQSAFMIGCDYLGMVSGRQNPDKLSRAGFHTIPSNHVDAPVIEELAFCLECRMIDYNPDTCRLRGEIVNVSIDERVLDEDGRVDVEKLSPIMLDPVNRQYRAIGEKLGDARSIGTQLKSVEDD